MLNFLSQNWGTTVICFFLACVVAAIIVKFIRDKKHGRSSCCGNCKHCSGACSACRDQGKTNR